MERWSNERERKTTLLHSSITPPLHHSAAPLPVPKKLTHDRHVFLLALLSGLPAVVVALALLWRGGPAPTGASGFGTEPLDGPATRVEGPRSALSSRTQWTLTIFVLGAWWAFAMAVRERVIRPLQTITNLLSALREGGFSVPARGGRRG